MKKRNYTLFITTLLILLATSACQDNTEKVNSSINNVNPEAQNSKSNISPEDQVCYNPNAKGDTSKKSIKSAVNGKIGAANLSITYHSPGVRDRVIWGGLIPYGEVWVTGAHNATTLETDKPIKLGDKELAAGKYAFFTIPGKEEWTVIINRNWDQHLADDYQQTEDVLRLQIKPVENDHTERLQYFIEAKGENTGLIAFAWEKLRFELPISLVDGSNNSK